MANPREQSSAIVKVASALILLFAVCRAEGLNSTGHAEDIHELKNQIRTQAIQIHALQDSLKVALQINLQQISQFKSELQHQVETQASQTNQITSALQSQINELKMTHAPTKAPSSAPTPAPTPAFSRWNKIKLGDWNNVRGITSSSDGTKLAVAGCWSGNSNGGDMAPMGGFSYIWVSNNSGVNLTKSGKLSSPSCWVDISASSDFTRLAALDSGGYIHVSDDSAASFHKVQVMQQTNNQWQDEPQEYTFSIVTISSDGSTLAAVTTSTGQTKLFVSTNNGVTWEASTGSGSIAQVMSSLPNGAENLNTLIVSNDGTKMVATSYNSNNGNDDMGEAGASPSSCHVWTSKDSGSAWSKANISSRCTLVQVGSTATYSFGGSYSYPTSPSHSALSQVTMSNDGSKLAAVSSDDIWLSRDSGSTWHQASATVTSAPTTAAPSVPGWWSAITASGAVQMNPQSTNQPTPAPANGWSSITASSDGTKLAAATNSGSIWMSSDAGESWSPAPGTENDGNGWYSIASSSDGTTLFAAAGNHTGLVDYNPTRGACIAMSCILEQQTSLWVSRDSGATWSKAPGTENTRMWNSLTWLGDEEPKLSAISKPKSNNGPMGQSNNGVAEYWIGVPY